MHYTIETTDDLVELYGAPGETSLRKVSSKITDKYRALIESSPFCGLATVGPEGLDCSPRGDAEACVFILDDTTLVMPDRHGNNRLDSLKNIVRDPRVALLMLIPGSGTTLRINGTAKISIDPELLDRYAMAGKKPRSIIMISINEIYFQCARAVIRAGLWDSEKHKDPSQLPSPGSILQDMSQDKIDGKKYDLEWPERAAETMW
ncbi:MAG: pyridoxamine 5'-phosphate oxidase family protein [Rhodobacteraceae bacterium]|nr:pyridoxamine 5'-phosphate oxidase family protein [Paracoccaceae bacterium]